MATARITRREYDEITATFSYLLGRIIEVHRCPLTDEEMAQAWENTLPKDYVEAYRTMERYAVRSQQKTNTVIVPVMHESIAYKIRFHESGYPNTYNNENQSFCIYQHPYLIPLTHLGLSAEKLEEFTTWMKLCPPLLGKSMDAYKVITDILGMAATVGQVKRMAPELIQYMSEGYREATKKRQRRSPLSPEWSAYPRQRVRECIETLALCHLLPAGSRMHGYVEDIPWVSIEGKEDVE